MRTVPFGAGGAIPRPLFHARTSVLWLLAPAIALLIARARPVRADMVQGEPVVGDASWYGGEFAGRSHAPPGPPRPPGLRRAVRPGSAVAWPATRTRSPDRARRAGASSAPAGATTSAKPMPMLKARYISSSAI